MPRTSGESEQRSSSTHDVRGGFRAAPTSGHLPDRVLPVSGELSQPIDAQTSNSELGLPPRAGRATTARRSFLGLRRPLSRWVGMSYNGQKAGAIPLGTEDSLAVMLLGLPLDLLRLGLGDLD